MTDYITLTGWVGTDPEQRTTPQGRTITTFRLATSRDYQDRTTQKWVKKDSNWYNVALWDDLSDNAHRSLTKGDPVIVVGRLELNTWSRDVQGENGTVTRSGINVDVTAHHIGHNLARGTAVFTRTEKKVDGSGGDVQEWATTTPGGDASGDGDATREPAAVGASAEPETPF